MTTSSNDFAAWLATDAGRAAIRAGVDARLRDIAAAVLKRRRDATGQKFTAYEAIIGVLADVLDAAPREPAQDEPAAGVTPEPPQHAEAMADLLRELEGWKDGPNSSDDTRRKYWLMRRAEATIRALAAQRDDLETERNDLIYTRQLAPPAASQPAQEPAAGARRETPHSGPEFGWVIERGDTPVFAPLYFAFHQHAGGDLNDDPPNGWLWDFDNLKAARFARREDAEKFWTCAIGRDCNEVRVAEHGWGTPPAAPDPLLPGLRAARDMIAAWEPATEPPSETGLMQTDERRDYENQLIAARKLRDAFVRLLDAEIARRGGA